MRGGLMKTPTEMQLVPITKLVPYVNNARAHSPEQINKPLFHQRIRLHPIPSSSNVTMLLLPVAVIFLPPRREALPKRRAPLLTTLPKPRSKRTSLQTTAWRWTQAGMKNSCMWRLSLCKLRTSTRSSPVLTKRSCRSYSMTARTSRRMNSMWMSSCKSRPSPSPAASGRRSSTGSSAATAQKRDLHRSHGRTKGEPRHYRPTLQCELRRQYLQNQKRQHGVGEVF